MSMSTLWLFSHCGERHNTAHFRVYCIECVNHHLITQMQGNPNAEDLDVVAKLLTEKAMFIQGEKIILLSMYYWSEFVICQLVNLLAQLEVRNLP